MIANAQVQKMRTLHPDQLRERLDALQHEWDLDRAMLVAVAAIAALVAVRHVLGRWTPPAALLRALGFRARRDIDEERRAVLDLLATHPGR